MKKMLLLLVFPFIFAAKIHSAQNEPDTRYGSFGLVLNEAQKGRATYLHFFDIEDPDANKKSLISRLWKQERKISTQEMEDVSKGALLSMRKPQFNEGSVDHIVLDASMWGLEEKIWSQNKLKLDAIFLPNGSAVGKKHGVIIYTVADDTQQTPAWHANRIDFLKKGGDSLVINVSKGMWAKMYGLVTADKAVEVCGEKPSNYMFLLIVSGGAVVSGLIVYLYHKYLQ